MLLDNRQTHVLEVEVTQEDIDRARADIYGDGRSVGGHCPLAQALMRQHGGHWGITTRGGVRWSGDNTFEIHSPIRHDGGAIVFGFDHGTPITGRVRVEFVA